MLNDQQIIEIRKDKEYKRLTELNWKNLMFDILKSDHSDFKPEISFVIKTFLNVTKARRIRKELCTCSRDFLERIINFNLAWKRIPESVKRICESDTENFYWMRYDEPRVTVLFNRIDTIISEVEFRHLLISTSTITKDKNLRLLEIMDEIEALREKTLNSLRKKAEVDYMLGKLGDIINANDEKKLRERFIKNSITGALGSIPKELMSGNIDEEELSEGDDNAENKQQRSNT